MAKEDREKNNKKSYLNSFQLNEQGNYEYRGKVYKAEDMTMKSYLVRFALPGVILLALSIMCGIIPADGMQNCYYIILPWLWCLISCVLLANNIIRMRYITNEVREYHLEKIKNAMPVQIWSGVIAGIATLLGMIVFLCIQNRIEQIVWTILFLVAHILIITLLFCIKIQFGKIEWLKTN